MTDEPQVSLYYVTVLVVFIIFTSAYFLYSLQSILHEYKSATNPNLNLSQIKYIYKTGEKFDYVLDYYSMQLKVPKSHLMLDCEKNATFIADKYAVCFIRDKNQNESYVINMRVSFEKVR